MSRFIATTIALILLAQTTCLTTHAAQQKNRKKQNNAEQAAAQAAEQQQLSRMNEAAQPRQVQIAQRMIAQFDQDGDAALNLVELQAGLAALFGRMSQPGMPGVMNGAMTGAGVNPVNGRAPAENQLRGHGGQTGSASGFRGGPRGR